MKACYLIVCLAVGLFGCGPMTAEEEAATTSQALIQSESTNAEAEVDSNARALPSSPETEAGVQCICTIRCQSDRNPLGRATYKSGKFSKCGC